MVYFWTTRPGIRCRGYGTEYVSDSTSVILASVRASAWAWHPRAKAERIVQVRMFMMADDVVLGRKWGLVEGDWGSQHELVFACGLSANNRRFRSQSPRAAPVTSNCVEDKDPSARNRPTPKTARWVPARNVQLERSHASLHFIHLRLFAHQRRPSLYHTISIARKPSRISPLLNPHVPSPSPSPWPATRNPSPVLHHTFQSTASSLRRTLFCTETRNILSFPLDRPVQTKQISQGL